MSECVEEIKFKKDVVELQKRLLTLAQDEVLFTVTGNEDILPISRAKVIVISRGYTPHSYTPLKLRRVPAVIVASLPVIWRTVERVGLDGPEVLNTAHVGGPGWFEYKRGKHHVSYAHGHGEQVRGFEPVGVEIDILEHNWRNPLWSHYSLKEVCLVSKKGGISHKKEKQHKKMVQAALKMTDPLMLESMPGYDVNGFIEMRLPDILFVPGKKPLQLTASVDEVVLDAVNMGLWRIRDGDILIPGLQAPHRGKVVRSPGLNDYMFTPDEDPEDSEDDCSEIHHRTVCSMVEDRIQELFHIPVRAELYPTFPEGESRVARGSMLFAPRIPTGSFRNINQLEKEIGKSTLSMYRYLAALTRARVVNGLPALDSDVACGGGGEPYLDLTTVVPRVQKLVDAPLSLKYRKGLWEVNLDDFQARRRNKLENEELQLEYKMKRFGQAKVKLEEVLH